MELALAQLQISPGATDANLDSGIDAITTADESGADLVVLPELFRVGYFAFDSYDDAAQSLDGPALTAIADAASEHGIAVLAGSIVENLAASTRAGFETPADDGLANTAVLFDRNGERRGIYRKHHLFGYDSAEQDRLTPGDSLTTVEFGAFTVGITTCYDLRFPELYRELVDRGVTLVLVPSAWPYPRVEHWQLLPRARAVENLCYVAAANGVGEFDGAELLGRSTVYDPWGTAVAGAGDEAALVETSIDPERVERRREAFPALADRRQ